jgi:hypothetical protein
MLGFLAVAAAGWLGLLIVLLAVPWTGPPEKASAPGGRAGLAGDPEPPAVVSLLAGRLKKDGYPATLLDLAARGWLRVEHQPGGPLMCVIPGDLPRERLTQYERQACAHIELRASGLGQVPAQALGDGFPGRGPAGPVGVPPAMDSLNSARENFAADFRREVIADARRRGLTRARLSSRAGILLGVAAIVPAVAAGLVLRAQARFIVPFLVFMALFALVSALVQSERCTAAGWAALRGWRSRAAPASARSQPLAWTDRRLAYAAALGRAPAAVALYTRPDEDVTWSGYGGRWRQITIGDPLPRTWPNGGMVWFYVAFAFPAVSVLAVLGTLVVHGAGGHLMQAGALAIVVVGTLLLSGSIAHDNRRPSYAEFDGQVIEAWAKVVKGDENGETTYQCLAIDDGVRDEAWAVSVSGRRYAALTPGTLVHVIINPRRNKVLDIRPLTRR